MFSKQAHPLHEFHGYCTHEVIVFALKLTELLAFKFYRNTIMVLTVNLEDTVQCTNMAVIKKLNDHTIRRRH